MGDISGGNFYMNNHTLSQQYFDSNNGDVSNGNGFIKSTLSPCVIIQVSLGISMGMLKRLM